MQKPRPFNLCRLAMPTMLSYQGSMKLLPLLGCILLVAACAEQRPEDIPRTLKRGVQGEGTLYQPDRADDPFIKTKPRVGT